MIAIRPATAGDQRTIVRLVRAAQINPMDLKWQNFVLAVDEDTHAIVGAGQVKQHRDGSFELASILTVPAYQGRGVASHVIEHLLRQHSGELYLTCLSGLGPFYERFGFREIGPAEMPPYFRRIQRLVSTLTQIARQGQRLLVMKRPPLQAE
jgi:amino-acid N-acetyltransferase